MEIWAFFGKVKNNTSIRITLCRLANDKKGTPEERIIPIRFMVAAEFEATELYIQVVGSTGNLVWLNAGTEYASLS
jgi:hypothetical protein